MQIDFSLQNDSRLDVPLNINSFIYGEEWLQYSKIIARNDDSIAIQSKECQKLTKNNGQQAKEKKEKRENERKCTSSVK